MLRRSGELGDDLNPTSTLKVDTFQTPQAELAIASVLQQQGSDVRLFRISAYDANTILEIGFSLCDRLPIDDPN